MGYIYPLHVINIPLTLIGGQVSGMDRQWLKRLSYIRSAMEQACVWTAAEDKQAAVWLILASKGRQFSSPGTCCQLRAPAASLVMREYNDAQVSQMACSRL